MATDRNVNLTDLEITKLCAKSMGLTSIMIYKSHVEGYGTVIIRDPNEFTNSWIYDPLHDDAQAMALVKKFDLECTKHYPYTKWCVSFGTTLFAENKDLNRAICECVAQKAKNG